MIYDRFLEKLDAAGDLGISLAAEAAVLIRVLQREAEELRARCAESRADCLAAAYAKLCDGVRAVREIARDLDYYGCPDVDVEIEDVARRLHKGFAALECEPDATGAAIVREALRATELGRWLRETVATVATANGLAAEDLHRVGIWPERFDYSTGDTVAHGAHGFVQVAGPRTAVLTLRGNDDGYAYLADLFERLQLR